MSSNFNLINNDTATYSTSLRQLIFCTILHISYPDLCALCVILNLVATVAFTIMNFYFFLDLIYDPNIEKFNKYFGLSALLLFI